MRRGTARSPYFWALVGVLAVVALARIVSDGHRPVAVGTQAPEFTARDLGGGAMSVSDYEGHVILLNVWATWCAPCLEEMPSMQNLYEEFSDEDFEILAVSVDAPFGESDQAGRPGGDLAAFARDLGLTFPILGDPQGRVQAVFQTTGVPETFLIGRDGLIYKKVAGGTQWDSAANRELVRRLLDA